MRCRRRWEKTTYWMVAKLMNLQKAVELITVWKDENVTSALKIRVMTSMVWAVFQYGVEGWTLKKSDRNRIESFEMWCWRKMLGNFLEGTPYQYITRSHGSVRVL